MFTASEMPESVQSRKKPPRPGRGGESQDETMRRQGRSSPRRKGGEAEYVSLLSWCFWQVRRLPG